MNPASVETTNLVFPLDPNGVLPAIQSVSLKKSGVTSRGWGIFQPSTTLHKSRSSVSLGYSGCTGSSRRVIAKSASKSTAGTNAPKIRLLGPLRVINANDDDVTPSGGVRKALLAILLLAPEGTRSRVRLQDILWEGSSQSQGSANLRTALSLLRKELRDGLGFDPITTDPQIVSIDLKQFDLDISPSSADAKNAHFDEPDSQPELLEGLQLRGGGSEEFEDWLRSARQQWVRGLSLPERNHIERVEIPSPKIISAVIENSSIFSAKKGIGLLPVIVEPDGGLLTHFADLVLDAIATDLAAFSLVEIYDYRDGESSLPVRNSGPGPEILLRIKLAMTDGHYALQFHAYIAATRKVIGGASVSGDSAEGLNLDNAVISGFIAQNVDRLLSWIEKPGNGAELGADTPYQLLNTMFRFDAESVDAADCILTSVMQNTDDPVYPGLLAYLYTFKVGEHWGIYDQRVEQTSGELVREVLARNPLDGLSLTSAGHVLGYTLHNYELSRDLLEKAVRLNPSIAYCWDHLALHYLYTGNYRQAMVAARRSIMLGAFSPFRFTYDTTMCMVSTLSGDHNRAVEYGKRALFRRPNFSAALRYMTVSLAHLHRDKEAHLFGRKLMELDPEFSVDWVESGRWTLPDGDAKKLVRQGLHRAGLT